MNIAEAQTAIAQILAELERDTGTLAKKIEIISIDTTKFSDSRTQLTRRVYIELEYVPGSNWA